MKSGQKLLKADPPNMCDTGNSLLWKTWADTEPNSSKINCMFPKNLTGKLTEKITWNPVKHETFEINNSWDEHLKT